MDPATMNHVTAKRRSAVDCDVPASTADLAALGNVMADAFGMSAAYQQSYFERIGRDGLRCARLNSTVAGGLAIYRLGQWFGGRSVSMAGIAAVAVAPEHRGSGVARALLTHTLRELHAAEIPLSALYPATHALYRSVGYEQAGNRAVFRLPAAAFTVGERSVPMHAMTPADSDRLVPLYREWARRGAGLLDRAPAIWQRLLDPLPDGSQVRAHLVGDPGSLIGYVVHVQRGGRGEPIELIVRDLVALTPAAARRLLTFFGDHRSVVREVTWCGPLIEPLLCHLPELDQRIERVERWHLRVVHVPAALRERGYPEGVEGELHLAVSDAVIPENEGRFVLRVHDGRGEVTPGGRGDLTLDVRGLAPLYSGFLTPQTLAELGFLAGPPPAIAAAARLFAGPEPWMADFF
jgi:predicted acetyltransferase